MMNPFNDNTYKHAEDLELIQAALNGSSTALESLVKRHQDYIYNIALKMVMNVADAQDLTQEVLVKMVTKLSQFKGKSTFRTWLYRITFNHFLKLKKTVLEEQIESFDNFGRGLDSIQDVSLTEEQKMEQRELIKEAKLGCMSGMLLCLSREQRLVYILGEIFEADHGIGSEILEISKANFRKRLERARRDLYNFMNQKCGLVNKANPCRCARKTTGFIKEGWVDQVQMRFNADYVQQIYEALDEKNEQLDELLSLEYADLFKAMPFQEKQHAQRLLKTLFENQQVRDTFNLN
ncbi:MAG: RNA polymerase sigma factor [Bacteroidota bacterium]